MTGRSTVGHPQRQLGFFYWLLMSHVDGDRVFLQSDLTDGDTKAINYNN